MEWSGEISGSIAQEYNNNFLPTRETVTGSIGSSSVVFGYDSDLLVMCASPSSCSPGDTDALLVTRRTDNGFVSGVDLGNVREDITYNTFGELASQVATYANFPLSSFVYDQSNANRDALGRIIQKTESVLGTTRVYRYTYDDLNRLRDVWVDGVLQQRFEYDLNSNRLSTFTAPAETIEGTYDEQDRLLSLGDYVFAYGANGELESKTNTVTGETWHYQYDVLGNLLGVTLPDGDLVEYLVDARRRRIGKKINGVLVKQWLYRGKYKLAAELDGSGNVVAQFVYASRSYAPDFLIRNGQLYRILADHLGSPRLVVNVADSTDVPYRADSPRRRRRLGCLGARAKALPARRTVRSRPLLRRLARARAPQIGRGNQGIQSQRGAVELVQRFAGERPG
jgi:YD repeat-containing protein